MDKITTLALFATLTFASAAGASTPKGMRYFLRQGEQLEVSESGNTSIQWYEVLPISGDYDNRKACEANSRKFGCHDKIHYTLREILNLRGKNTFNILDFPQLSAVGTHRITPVRNGDVPEANEELATRATTLVVRDNDSYVGYVSELLGVPFVLWPRYLPENGHQTDAELAADCVAVTIYGKRRSGCSIPYVGPSALYRYADRVEPDAKGVTHVRSGDLLHFGFQTAVVGKVNSPDEILGNSDSIIHSYHGLVERVRFDQLPYRSSPYQVLRWKACESTVVSKEASK